MRGVGKRVKGEEVVYGENRGEGMDEKVWEQEKMRWKRNKKKGSKNGGVKGVEDWVRSGEISVGVEREDKGEIVCKEWIKRSGVCG